MVDLTHLVMLCLIAQGGRGIPGSNFVPLSILVQIRTVARSCSTAIKSESDLRILIDRLNFLGKLHIGHFFCLICGLV